MSAAPDHLPLLARGAHDDPSEGVCLMEYVSLIAGERFSDHPRCTDPLLAGVARVVNDHISDDARPSLTLLAPDLVGATSKDPRLAPMLVVRCVDAALTVDPHSWWLRRAGRWARRRLERLDARAPSSRWERWRDRLAALRSPAAYFHNALFTLVHAELSNRDARLRTLLAECVSDTRRLGPSAGREAAALSADARR